MKIKICGLTEPKEAAYLNAYGADFAGFVLYYPKSKRNNAIAQAKEIMGKLNPSIKRVAVVVSPTEAQIMEISQARFDYIQIHGTLDENLLSTIPLPVLRAFNVKDMAEYAKYGRHPQIAGYVFDAAQPGSGATFDWKILQQVPRDGKLLFLAGGLHPGNVAQAIRAVRPDGVDVSSGVEYQEIPGKDPDKIKKFISAARNA